MSALRSAARGALVALALMVSAAPLAAQSLLAAGGLGLAMDPVDGRSRALGAVGPGLFGTAVIPGDPVASVDLGIPTIAISMQSSWLSLEEGSESSKIEGARFPSLGVSYPARRWGVVTVTYGGVLDQRWTLSRQHGLPLNAGVGNVSVTDHFISDGGVAAARIGFARRVSRRVSLGVDLGTYTGSVVRSYTRVFDSLVVGVPMEVFQSGGRWGYSGVTATLGGTFDVAGVIRAAGTATFSSSLTADPLDDSVSTGKKYDMPVQLRGGISGTLAPGLSAVVTAAYADWSGTTAQLAENTQPGRSTLSMGAGLEWEGGSFLGRTMPVRLGWRHADLPFQLGNQDAVEKSLVGGLGWQLVRAGTVPIAELDVGLEKGSRTAGGLSETFWRTTASLRLAGF